MEPLRERIQQIKERRPIYRDLVDFYGRIREEQEKIKGSLKVDPILPTKELKDLLAEEGFPLLQREEFPLDLGACITLFQTLCRIAKDANPHMSEQVPKIEEALGEKGGDLKELMKEILKNRKRKIERISKKFGLDEKVLLFLIENSTKPSIEAGMETISKGLEPTSWFKGICPICGSLPSLSLLEEESGKRSLVCSFCGYQWGTERLLCPFCNNREAGSLHYFYAEGEESCRIDVCEKCRHYIKTFDLRKRGVSDPSLEDVATLHLDILASQKGYQRAVPSPWGS